MSDPQTTLEEVRYVEARIIRAFDHIEDEEYRSTIAGCWARAAIDAYKEFQNANN
jgi:hypothetical protein